MSQLPNFNFNASGDFGNLLAPALLSQLLRTRRSSPSQPQSAPRARRTTRAPTVSGDDAQEAYVNLLAQKAMQGGFSGSAAESELGQLARRDRQNETRRLQQMRREETQERMDARGSAQYGGSLGGLVDKDASRLQRETVKTKWQAVQKALADPRNPLTEQQAQVVLSDLERETKALGLPNPMALYLAEEEADDPKVKLARAREEWPEDYSPYVQLNEKGEVYVPKEIVDDIKAQRTTRQKAFEEEIKVWKESFLGDPPSRKDFEDPEEYRQAQVEYGAKFRQFQLQADVIRRRNGMSAALGVEDTDYLQQNIFDPSIQPTGLPGQGATLPPRRVSNPRQFASQNPNTHYVNSQDEAKRLLRSGKLKTGDKVVLSDGTVATAN